MKKENSQYDKYQLTINNPMDHDLDHVAIKTILIQNFTTLQFACMADEKGTTLHTHIFFTLSSRVRVSKVKKHFPKAHIECVKGSVSDNIDYISKTGKWQNDVKHGTVIEGTYEEFGDRPSNSKGEHRDLEELYNLIKDGWTNAEILEYNQDYILSIDKLDKIRTILLTEHFKGHRRLDLDVTYVYGTTGTGKTRGILDEYGDANVYRVTDYLHPFDGYNCQNILVFDEFRNSLPLKEMLNYLDIYPIELPSRYSNKFMCAEKIFIVSNWKLEDQYKELQRDDSESWNAFLRRVKKVKVYSTEEIKEYNSVSAYYLRDSQLNEISIEEQSTINSLFT